MTMSSSSHANPTPTRSCTSSEPSTRHVSSSSQSSPNAMSTRPTTLPIPLSPPPATVSSPPATFDLKRLLAKPAPPYARNYGSGSDSEGMSDSAARTRGVHLVDRGFVTPQTKEEIKTRLGRSKSVQPLLRDREAPQEKEREKRPRNVLRRRPSTQKSPPAVPTMSPTTATAALEPLPFLSPRSPLTPSMLPSSPASTYSRGSSPRPTTAPSPTFASRALSASSSSLDKPLPVPPAKGKEGYGGAQPRRERSREFSDTTQQAEYVINVTDEKGKHVNARKRLRELKGHPFPSSPSPSPSQSRSHSPSVRLHHHPQNVDLSASSVDSIRATSNTYSRSPSNATPKSKTLDSNPNLTPAAAVVAAYKRQTLLQDPPNGRTAGGSNSIDTASMSGFSRLSFGGDGNGGGAGFAAIERIASEAQESSTVEGEEKETSKTDSPNGEGADDENTHQPYYTIFGASSGRVVAVGGPDDNHHLSWEISAPVGLARKGSGLRSLTRKVSGRFRRGASEGEERERERSRDADRKVSSVSVERGRPSLQQERPSTSGGLHRPGKRATMAALGRGEKGGRSLRLSIDKFPEEAKALKSEKKDTPPTSASKSSPASVASTPSPSNGGGGNRIWKLMKRISTGALREKYTYDEPPPPVPSLPKEYMSPAIQPVSVVDDEKGIPSTPPSAGGFGKSVRKKASLVLGTRIPSAGGSPTKAKLPRSPLSSHGPMVRPSPPAPRPSTTTRSSSPMSSEASTRFFSGPGYKHSSASAHSSASSLLFEDTVPPLPQVIINQTTGSTYGKHIVPPSELGKMGVNVLAESEEGHEGSQESLLSSSRHNLSQVSPTPAPSRSQMMKLKVVVPPTTTSSKDDEYVVIHTPAAELASLPPPRRIGRPGRGVRRDTNTPTMAENGWREQQQQKVAQAKEMGENAVDENAQEWERMWGSASGHPGENKDDEAREVDSRSGSPIIPSFSTVDPINAFVSKRSSTDTRRSKMSPTSASPSMTHSHPAQLDGMGYSPAESLPPPPRPLRSANRPNRPASVSTPTSPVSAPLSPRTLGPGPSSPPSLLGSPNANRRSTGGHSIASTLTITNAHRRRRSSSFLSGTSPPSPPASAPSSSTSSQRAITFRELGRANTSAAVLTEQEKAARWDDLLERSEKAGGTIHLNVAGRSGEDGLKSDRLRFSDISELTIM